MIIINKIKDYFKIVEKENPTICKDCLYFSSQVLQCHYTKEKKLKPTFNPYVGWNNDNKETFAGNCYVDNKFGRCKFFNKK